MIQLNDISVWNRERKILSVPYLSIDKEVVTGIIGHNGAGKSTLLKIIALLQQPQNGEIHISGRKVCPGKFSIEERRKISVVFQNPLMLETTTFKNIAIGLRYRNISRKEINKRVNEWLDRFEISHLAKRKARELSGGEVQRVALARAFVTNPEILFLDEPFSALDLPTRRKLLLDLKSILSETKTTTIFISHDYHEIKFLCEDVVILYKGEVAVKTKVNTMKECNLPLELRIFLNDWMTPLIE